MRLLITGGSSTLGDKLVSDLLETRNFSIRLLEHQSPVKKDNCEIAKGDVTDVSTLNNACLGIDAVFHLAALSRSHRKSDYIEVNEGGTRNIIAACKKNNVTRFIFVSSGTASENGGAYAVSKLRGEELVRGSGLKWVIVRPSEVYGPQMNEGIGKMITWVNKYKIIPIVGDGSYLLHPVYLDDVTSAMVEIIKRDTLDKEVLDLCGPEQLLFNELIDRLSEFLGVRRKKIFVPLWCAKVVVHFLTMVKSDLVFSDQIPRLLLNKEKTLDRARAIIPYNPRTLEEGLRSFGVDNP